MKKLIFLLTTGVAAASSVVLVSAGSSAPGATAQTIVCEAHWRDAARNRDVPVRIRLPRGGGSVPLILFSHGLGGNLDAGTIWAQAWAENGFAGSTCSMLAAIRPSSGPANSAARCQWSS